MHNGSLKIVLGNQDEMLIGVELTPQPISLVVTRTCQYKQEDLRCWVFGLSEELLEFVIGRLPSFFCSAQKE